MSGFYKLDPAAWNWGAVGLSLEAEAALLQIVNAIHLHDRPVPNNERTLAGLFRCSTRKARSLRDGLIEAGKIRIEGGCIVNDRAISELFHRGFISNSRAESGAKGGRTRAERAAKALENNEPAQAIASSRIEENRREENTIEADASIARQSSRKPETQSKRAAAIPEDWKPSERNIADATYEGFSHEEIRNEAAQFRDHHRSKGSRFIDLDAAWRTWIRNARKFARRGAALDQRAAAASDALRNRIEAAARNRSPSKRGICFD